ncbi:hypothetical protein BKA63DRAFT_506919 [Paraphoma chrysanthemicola]|nr:hypothetical protein BKA63DRAFT_506919 [Paraphoma chrysanthemicola]
MGGNSSTPIKEEEKAVSQGPVIPDLGGNAFTWTKHPGCIQLVEQLRAESPEIRKLSDEQMGNLLILNQSCGDAGSDSRKLAEIFGVICQAESSLINIETEHPQSSEIGLAQQNKLFGQRDSKGYWKQYLSKEERLDPKASAMRSYRILNKEQKGESDWRYKELSQACYELQRCEPNHRSIYSKPARIEVARILARTFYPTQSSMLDESSPRSGNENHSNATKFSENLNQSFAVGCSMNPQYIGPVDSISVVDQCKVMGLDSSFKSRAALGQELGISGNPGSTEFNLGLLNELRLQS